ncbi:MAG TPA: hypothetical protein VFV30_05690, partial [Novosphingobium sp.]|nr:hypothetical protein [Novosphingobium sp.]
MKRALLLSIGGLLTLSSAWAVALASPESLLPPGFERPKARPGAAAAPGGTSTPVVQPLPGAAGAAGKAVAAPAGTRLPSLREIEAMSPDELDELLGLKPKYDIPGAARRSLKQVGVLAEYEGGLPAASLALQSGQLVQAVLDRNKGQLVSRWGHILLRRALASRLDAPAGMNPADFTASRAALLVRMGEGAAARAVVQDVDAGNYNPALTQAAIESYALTADITGICPVIAVQGGVRKDADWRVLRAICAAFQGDGASGMAQLERLEREGAWQKIDMLLARKYAGAAGKSRQAVKIEWDGVSNITPWRFALTTAVGLEPPASLMEDAPVRFAYATATAPMVGLEARAKAADRAAATGILSSAAMVDLYAQIYAQDDISGAWATSSETLREAYVAASEADRLAAIRSLWDGAGDAQARYSRQVLTAYAAARLPAGDSLAPYTGDLVASMLTAGLDRNAMRWLSQVEEGSLGWAQLVLVNPLRPAAVTAGALDSFHDADESDQYRKSRFLVAGLAGLGRVDTGVANDFAAQVGVDLTRKTRWTRLIDQAADVNNQALVVLLAGVGMQGDGWDKMTS